MAAIAELGGRATTVDATRPADHATIESVDLSVIDLVMASPGYPPHSPDVVAAQAAGLEVISEMEFAWRIRRRGIPWVLVTGTNGKTTTTQMVGAMARAGGLRVAVCGNMGEPVIEAATQDVDVVAVEIASLQLHFTSTVAPLAAVCLNADVDHLDWHGSVANYRAAKARVYRHVQSACVYPAHDPVVEAMVRAADVAQGCRAIGITGGAPDVSQLGVVDSILCDRAFLDDRATRAIELGQVDDLSHLVTGAVPPYLVANALSAAALVRAAGVQPDAVAEGLRQFRLDAHRSATVAVVDGVTYVDDSKATNAHAAAAAFGARAHQSVVWIAGGQAKGQRFDDLVTRIAPAVRAAVIIGVDSTPLLNALATHAPHIPVTVVVPGDTVMERAVAVARQHARVGDTVLLSPACASLDQFDDYAARGAAFVTAVPGQ